MLKEHQILVALFKYFLPLKDQQVRMQLQFWFLNKVSLSSQLVTYDDPQFIPLSVQCTFDKKISGFYELKYKGENSHTNDVWTKNIH